MSQEIIALTNHELDRLVLIQQCLDKKITQKHAANTLGISEQHFRYLIKAYREQGPKTLVSQQRGKPSNRGHSITFKELALAFIGSMTI